MKILSRLGTLLLLTILTAQFALPQQKRTTARPQPKPATVTTPAPAPTFDTLIGADCYKIYGEVRNVGQIIRSNSVNELLEPIIKLAGPPKEFRILVKWLDTHADEVMTSRMLLATWPTAKGLPDALFAIDFATPEEAAKFEPQLNGFLPKVLPPNEKQTNPEDENNKDKAKQKSEPPQPGFFLQRAGSLIVISPTALNLKNLRPSGTKLLSDDVNFKIAKNRFSSETIFIFVDIKGIEKEEEINRRRNEAEGKKKHAELAVQAADEGPKEDQVKESDDKVELKAETESSEATVVKEPTQSEQITYAVSALSSGFFSGQSKWPEAIAGAIDVSTDSFDARVLLLSAPGERNDAVPFIPQLVPGSPIVPESPAILPADTELFVVASLDFHQIYSRMASPPTPEQQNIQAAMRPANSPDVDPPFAILEKQLKIKIKEDLLPLLGSEIVVSLPVNVLDINVGPTKSVTTDSSATPDSSPQPQQQPKGPNVVVAISLRDKEGMRTLLPKIIDSLGFKGASAIAQTERRENTEIVSYAGAFAYAFVENFLILSSDADTTRHVVDSYLKHETLSSDSQFKNYTRWQPRQLQGQIYVSPALMETYKTWAAEPSAYVSDQTREFLSRFSLVSQPITYALSNDGMGPLHELHVPKNLVLLAVAGISGETNPPPMVNNERAAIGIVWMIASAESQFRSEKGAGSYGSLDQLIAEGMVNKESIENSGYRFEVIASGGKFQVSAVPVEYGKTGKLSFFIDESIIARAGDHGGGAASVADKPLR